MRKQEAQELALQLFKKHNIENWNLRYNNSVHYFGRTMYRSRTITLSATLVELNDETHVTDTILHEIAHVLAGSRAKHKRAWREVAISIGCNGSRTFDHTVNTPPKKWLGTCPNGHTTLKHKRFDLSCHKCAPDYDIKFRFQYVLNPEYTKLT